MKRPAMRPATSSPDAHNPARGGASRGFSTANGSAPSQSLSYLTPARLHQTSQSLTPPDWQILQFVHDARLASGQQLIRAFWHTHDAQSPAARRGRRALKRLVDCQVLQTLPRRVSGMRGINGLVYHAGRAGVRLLAARGIHGPRVETPGTLHLTHGLATTELALRLREADRDGVLELIEVEQEPVCWRSYPGAMSTRVLKPDLFVRIGAGAQEDRWMVEVDLGSESGRTIARKLATYAQHYRSGEELRNHGVHPRVVWLTPDEHRAQQIAHVLERQPGETRRLFTIRRFDDAISFLAAEARS